MAAKRMFGILTGGAIMMGSMQLKQMRVPESKEEQRHRWTSDFCKKCNKFEALDQTHTFALKVPNCVAQVPGDDSNAHFYQKLRSHFAQKTYHGEIHNRLTKHDLERRVDDFYNKYWTNRPLELIVQHHMNQTDSGNIKLKQEACVWLCQEDDSLL